MVRSAQALGSSASTCETQIRAARARSSLNGQDFACGGADDLARSLTEVGFAELRLSRLFGMVGFEPANFSVLPRAPRNPLLLATDHGRVHPEGSNSSKATPVSDRQPPQLNTTLGPCDSPWARNTS